MTKEEASNLYKIPTEVLDEYEKWGLCTEVRKVMGAWKYDDSDIEKLSMIMTLHDIGFSNEEIEKYMKLFLLGEETKSERKKLLDERRKKSLGEIHLKEKQLERIDYLRHKMKDNI